MFHRVFGGISSGAGKGVDAVVWLRGHGVVLYLKHMAVLGAHECGGLVAVAEGIARLVKDCEIALIGAVERKEEGIDNQVLT